MSKNNKKQFIAKVNKRAQIASDQTLELCLFSDKSDLQQFYFTQVIDSYQTILYLPLKVLIQPMKIPSISKQGILIKSLRKQLSVLVRNLDHFGISPPKIYYFIIDVVFSPHATPNPQDNNPLHSFTGAKGKTVKQTLLITNLVDSIIGEIQQSLASDKLLLKYLQDTFALNSSLTQESYISLGQKIETKDSKDQTLDRLVESMNKMSKLSQTIQTQSKNSYEETLISRRAQLFERQPFYRRQPQFQNEDQNQDQDLSESEYSHINQPQPEDHLMIMQREVTRLKEMQKQYQSELEAMVVQKKRILDKINPSISSRHPPEFFSVFSKN